MCEDGGASGGGGGGAPPHPPEWWLEVGVGVGSAAWWAHATGGGGGIDPAEGSPSILCGGVVCAIAQAICSSSDGISDVESLR
jgi:hypothetical protein